MSERIKKKEHSEHHVSHEEPKESGLDIWKTAAVVLGILLVLSIFTDGFRLGVSVNTVVSDLKALQSKDLPTNVKSAVTSALDGLSAVAGTKPADNGGNKGKAQIVIEEYSDFQCPFCGRAYPTVKQIEKEYGDKVEVVFKHFPLSFHENAQKASEASECARDQGKFPEMHDKLFENQQALTVPDLKKYAVDLGLNAEKFNKCLDSGEKATIVQNDFKAGQAKGIGGTPTFLINGEQLVGAQPFESFKAVIDRQLAGGAPAAAPTPTPEPTAPTAPTEVTASMDDDPVEGSKDAKVVIVEWSDFECPFCGRFYTQTMLPLREKYVETGKVRVVFRDFPLSFHPDAMPAALAAECADDQGKFWDMHDKVFENQATLSTENLKLWAQEMGLDMSKWNDCYDSKKYESEINADMASGGQSGVQGTPGFVIGIVQPDGKTVIGESIRGAQPLANFEAAIERQLAKV